MAYYGYGRWPRYVSVGEKRAKAQRKLKKLKKKNPNIRPIVIEGQSLARTWWGKAWNRNLEGYADYSNRIGRGRSYVRHGAVLDLQIEPGKVQSLVQGSRGDPYQVEIKIKSISKVVWKDIKTASASEMASLQQLLDGHFPKALGEIFTARGRGLFPSPKEIGFACSCPDWASMCKHVAATLYGIGTRLDEDPGLFFLLRKAKIDDLIHQTVKDQSKKLLEQARRKTSRVIEDTDLSDVFGIDLEETASAKRPKRPAKKAKAKASSPEARRKAPAKNAKKKAVKKKTVKKKVKKKTTKKIMAKKKPGLPGKKNAVKKHTR